MLTKNPELKNHTNPGAVTAAATIMSPYQIMSPE